ncbi:MAG: c-type cytochrome, partial [Rudaea sp.]
PPGQAAGQGAALFQQYCVGCHTIGGGVLVGPDLQGVTTRRTRDWLLKWIADPPTLIAQKDPTAVQLAQQYQTQMPNLALSQADVNALVDYLANPTPATAAGGTASPGTPVQIIPGNPANGRALIVGAVGLQNGGPACIGCHTVAGVGELGGGTLGPDLTGAFAKYGEQGLANFLNTYPLPTMKAVWTAIPLAPQEQADLRVFLQQAGTSPPPANLALLLAGIGAAGALVLLALAQFYWRKRLLGVRRPLLRRVLQERARVRPVPHG